MLRHILTILAITALLIPSKILAIPLTIDFESFADSDLLTNQFPGLTFANTRIFTAGITLNEFELPPHSGFNVAFDDGGPITIIFATPQSVVSGFFTHATPLTFTAFDAASNTLDMVTSPFNANLGLSGDAGSVPNAFLRVASHGGITRVLIEADPSGGSFALDDLAFTQVITAIPEPSTLLLLLSGITGLMGYTMRRCVRYGAQK